MSLTTKMEHVVLAYNLPRGPAVDRGKVAEAAHAEAEAALAAQPSMGALRVNNSASDPSRLIFREHLGSRAGFLNPPFKSIHATANLSSALFVGNQGGAIMRTLGKIAATLGVIGAIAASSTVPAAAWYGYHHHYYRHRYYGYHHRYYAYSGYDRERYYHYAGGGY